MDRSISRRRASGIRIKPEATFKALGADSLDCVELTMAAEEEFNIAIDDKVAVKIETIGR